MEIVFIENVDTGIDNWKEIENWVIDTVENESKSVGNLSFVVMDDEELLSFNRQYLDHDYYTDVITFDDSDFPVINGDVLLSLDMIKFNSKQLEISYKEEFLRVVIHGVLHLCGYKDKLDDEVVEMRSKEEFYLGRTNFVL